MSHSGSAWQGREALQEEEGNRTEDSPYVPSGEKPSPALASADDDDHQHRAAGTLARKAVRSRSIVARSPGLSVLVTDVALSAGAYVASIAAPLEGDAGGSLGWAAAFSLALVWLLAARGAYPRHLPVDLLEDLRLVLDAVVVVTMAFISVRVLLTGDAAVAQDTLGFSIYVAAFFIVERVSLAAVLGPGSRRDWIGSRTLILGAGKVGNLTARRLMADPRTGLDPVGFLDDDPLELPNEPAVLPVLGGPTDLDRIVAEHDIEHMIVGFSMASHQLMLSVVRRCWELGVSVSLVPRLFELHGDRAAVSRRGGLPLISVASAPTRGVAIALKHAIDRILAVCILTATAPLLGAIALVIKVTTDGPVFFGQQRVGRDGRHFTLWKFRSMTGTPENEGQANAQWVEAMLREQLSSAPGGDPVVPSGADRTTPLGNRLRRFGLDELPQLWNVFRGEMSLVGPRPEQVPYVDKFEQAVYRYRDRERVKSGITGWAQVNGLRGDTSLTDRVEWDNYYIENWSLWLDAKIVLMTIAMLWRGRRDRDTPRRSDTFAIPR